MAQPRKPKLTYVDHYKDDIPTEAPILSEEAIKARKMAVQILYKWWMESKENSQLEGV